MGTRRGKTEEQRKYKKTTVQLLRLKDSYNQPIPHVPSWCLPESEGTLHNHQREILDENSSCLSARKSCQGIWAVK